MKIDDTILKSIKIIKQEFFTKFGIEISEEELIDIAQSQLSGTTYGLKKGVSVKLPVIGSFLFIDRKKTMEEIKKLKNVEEFYSEIEFERKILEGKIATIKRNKKRWKEEKLNKLTVVEVVKRPNLSNSNILYDSLSQILKDKNGE